MDYKVLITEDAEADLDHIIRYLLFEKKSLQAASNVMDDFEATIRCISYTILQFDYMKTEGVE